MGDIDYKNGYVLLAGDNEYYFSASGEAEDAYQQIIDSINRGDKVADVKGKNTMISLETVNRLAYIPSAKYIREQYSWWNDTERDGEAGSYWKNRDYVKRSRAKYFQLMLRIGEHPEPIKGE